MGVGYHFYNVRPKPLLIFNKGRTLVSAWSKIIKWWPDPDIRMVFVEKGDSFEFVLYCDTRALKTTWVFLKALRMSEYYKRFRDDYEGAADLGLALYKPKDDSYEIEIFKYKKRVTDIKFQSEQQADKDPIVLKSRTLLNASTK